jgi:hypothetical protein
MVRKSDKLVQINPEKEKDYIHVEDGIRVIIVNDPKVTQKICQLVDDANRLKTSSGSGFEADFLVWSYIGSIFPETLEHPNWRLQFAPVTKPRIFEFFNEDEVKKI